MMNSKRNIAFLLLEVSDLGGGGGAERFFADLFKIYNEQLNPNYNLFFITDSYENYKRIGKFIKPVKNVIEIKSLKKWFSTNLNSFYVIFRKPIRLYLFANACFQLLKILVKNDIKLVHIALFTKFHYRFFKVIDLLPFWMRPKIVVNIVDCQVPYYYFSNKQEHIQTSAHRFHYEKLFNNVKIDGIFSWYIKFKEFAEEHNIIKSNPLIYVIKSRFVINHVLSGYTEKKKNIVFASRLVTTKRPLFFVNAILILKNRKLPKLEGWKFYIYGKGPLEHEILQMIKAYDLSDILVVNHNVNMAEIFRSSMCFVSTQDFENFPSLSMAEAMINRNAIISRNVGQTDYFVKDGLNGILLEEDTPIGLANAIEKYITNPECHDRFGEESYKLMTTVHTPENFIRQIDTFWSEILEIK